MPPTGGRRRAGLGYRLDRRSQRLDLFLGAPGPGSPIMRSMVHTMPFRFVALLLAAVLLIVAGAPAKADALEPLTIVAIAGLVVAGIVLIAYLVVANVEGDRSAGEGRVVWVACAAADGCATIPAEAAAALGQPVLEAADRQGP
jgi:hypothetical protein